MAKKQNTQTTTTNTKEEVTMTQPKMYTEDQVKAIIAKVTNQAAQVAQEATDRAVAQVEEKIEEIKPAVDVTVVYDALEAEAKKVNDEAIKAAKSGNMNLYNKLVNTHNEISAKMSALVAKHKDKIYSPERSKAIVSNARQSLADGLMKAADITDTYGHKGVDGLMTLATEILNGVVAVAQTTITVAGKVGHAGVDVVSGTLNATGEFVAPTKK